MPGVPFIYYGDEIGMRYRDLPTKEGGYVRTGSRTPMQWQSLASLNASYATPVITGGNYLPVDPSLTRPTSPTPNPTKPHCGIRCAACCI